MLPHVQFSLDSSAAEIVYIYLNYKEDNSIKKKRYIIIAITGLLSIFLIAVIFFFVYRPAPDKIPPHIFIALGDSVSSGYGLPGYADSPEGSHTSLFFAKLEREGYVDEYHNFATSGFTTTDLLEMLHNINDEELRLFQNANIITLNIGGNNILTPFLAYFSNLQIAAGTGNIRTGAGGILSGAWGVIYEIISGVGSVVSDSEEGGFCVGNVIAGLGDIFSGLGTLIIGAGEIIAGSPDVVSAWRGSLSPELEAALEEGVQIFSKEFREIIEWLKAHAPDATIIVNSLYNPIPKDILTMSVPIANWANVLITSMNQTILEESELNSFLVTDISCYFFNRTDFMSFNLNPFAGDLSFDIVHPNAEGHKLIARLQYKTFVNRPIR